MNDKNIEMMNISLSHGEKADFLFYLYKTALDAGMEDIANKSGIARTALYRMMGPAANPTLNKLILILNSMDLQLGVKVKSNHA
jgi:DNA-binding phage protein